MLHYVTCYYEQADRWGWGIIYLLFCWTYIPAIVGFIEGIMFLVSSPNDFSRKHDPAYR